MSDELLLSGTELRQFAVDASALMNKIEGIKLDQANANPERFNATPTSTITLIASLANASISSKLTLAKSLTKQELSAWVEEAFVNRITACYHYNYFQQKPFLQKLLDNLSPRPVERADIDAALKTLIQPQIDFYTSRLAELFDEHIDKSVGLSADTPEIDIYQYVMKRLGNVCNLDRIVQDVSTTLLTTKADDLEIVPSDDLKRLFSLLVVSHIAEELAPPDMKSQFASKVLEHQEFLTLQLESEGVYHENDRFLERIKERTDTRLKEILRSLQ